MGLVYLDALKDMKYRGIAIQVALFALIWPIVLLFCAHAFIMNLIKDRQK